VTQRLRFGARLNTHSIMFKRMGANMRRLVLLCFAFAFLSAGDAADAQTQPSAAGKRATAAKKGAAPAAPVDTRPRYKRDDTPASVVAAPPAAAPKNRTARRARGRSAQREAAAQGAKAGPRDVAACAQVSDHDAAIAGCTRVIEDDKQKPKSRAAAYYNRGNAHAAKGDHAAAIADYDAAIKLEPKNARAFNNRGTAHSDKGEFDAAIEDFGAAIRHDARLASAYFNRANTYAAKGEADRAIADYTTAIKHNRRNVNAYIARGALHLAGGAAAKAQADMKLAARLERRNAYAVLWQDIAERRGKQKGVLAGGKGLKDVEMKGWPAPLLAMFAGELKPDGALIAADDPNPALKEAHTCEANFYGGQYLLIQNSRDEAVKLFQSAAKDCPRGFLEGIAASAELKGMGEKL
jgi:lipoprotein NlpI